MLIMEDSLIGNGGDTPNGSGGMIPSTAPPFAMTRWVAQTRQNFVSMLPYNETDTSIHGFQVRRQIVGNYFCNIDSHFATGDTSGKVADGYWQILSADFWRLASHLDG